MKRFLQIALAMLIPYGCFASIDTTVPDQEGMTIKGIVYCGDNPVKGVQVSDGDKVVLTDAEGRYYLASEKSTGFVFICNPQGYRCPLNKKYPQFYQALTKGASEVEQHDFELIEDPSEDYTVLFLADVQMCGRNKDLQQYMSYGLPDLNATIAEHSQQGDPVYVITLGDQSYNTYWHKWNVMIPHIKMYLDKLNPAAFFQCMGNHDNSPDVQGDWEATIDYRKAWGPTYYSFNLGKIHYVVLDNIEYSNATGDMEYDCNIVTSIIKWLRRDLANVKKDTPLVVCMHAPFYSRPQCTTPNVEDAVNYRYDFGSTLYTSIKDFQSVKVFTGHAHTNYTVVKGKITEYNNGCFGGNLWWSGSFTDGNMVCCDGSPGGYRVMQVQGTDTQVYYKSIGYNKHYQFRSYDLNNCYISAERFAPDIANPYQIENWISIGNYGYGLANYNADGTPKEPDQVLINVFGWDSGWSVEVTEEGTPLQVLRVSDYDPFSMISDGCLRFNYNGSNASNPVKNSHMFKVQASGPATTLNIKVTDPYGNVYTEQMERPKEFSITRYLEEDGSGYSGLQGIEVTGEEMWDAKPEYYTLSGMRVEHPTSGFYIMRQGNKTKKVIIK